MLFNLNEDVPLQMQMQETKTNAKIDQWLVPVTKSIIPGRISKEVYVTIWAPNLTKIAISVRFGPLLIIDFPVEQIQKKNISTPACF